MFSMAIGSIILVLAASTLGTSGVGYERISGSVATEREARSLMTQLAADLSSSLFHKDAVIEKSTAVWPSDRIGFLSLQPATAQSDASRIGDLCAVHYYLHDLTIGSHTVRCLMRGFRESKNTFEALSNKDLSPLFSKPGISQLPASDEPVAFGILSFQVWPKSRDTAGKLVDWVESDTKGPEALEVRIVVARRELVSKLKTPNDWDGVGAAAKFIGKASEADCNKDLEIYASVLRYGNQTNH